MSNSETEFDRHYRLLKKKLRAMKARLRRDRMRQRIRRIMWGL